MHMYTHTHRNPLNQGFLRNMRIFQDKMKIEWILEFLGLSQCWVLNTSHLFWFGYIEYAIRAILCSLWKNCCTRYSMTYTLSSKVASSIKELNFPRLSWWCMITINCIWLMHASNGHSINVFQSVCPVQMGAWGRWGLQHHCCLWSWKEKQVCTQLFILSGKISKPWHVTHGKERACLWKW